MRWAYLVWRESAPETELVHPGKTSVSTKREERSGMKGIYSCSPAGVVYKRPLVGELLEHVLPSVVSV